MAFSQSDKGPVAWATVATPTVHVPALEYKWSHL